MGWISGTRGWTTTVAALLGCALAAVAPAAADDGDEFELEMPPLIDGTDVHDQPAPDRLLPAPPASPRRGPPGLPVIDRERALQRYERGKLSRRPTLVLEPGWEVSLDDPAWGTGYTLADSWAIYDGYGERLDTRAFAEIVGDRDSVAWLDQRRSRAWTGFAVMMSTGLVAVFTGAVVARQGQAVRAAAQPGDPRGHGTAAAGIGTLGVGLALVGTAWLAPHEAAAGESAPADFYAAWEVDELIEEYNASLRRRLGLGDDAGRDDLSDPDRADDPPAADLLQYASYAPAPHRPRVELAPLFAGTVFGIQGRF